jgi:hypothetical protein
MRMYREDGRTFGMNSLYGEDVQAGLSGDKTQDGLSP